MPAKSPTGERTDEGTPAPEDVIAPDGRPSDADVPYYTETRAERTETPEGIAVIDVATGETLSEEHERAHVRTPEDERQGR